MVNAAFAMATAIGAASGPGGAILLDMVPEFQFTLPILGIQTFNGMTGPGFVMALLWFVFLIAIVFSLLVAWLSVGYQAVSAAVANPVKALRAE